MSDPTPPPGGHQPQQSGHHPQPEPTQAFPAWVRQAQPGPPPGSQAQSGPPPGSQAQPGPPLPPPPQFLYPAPPDAPQPPGRGASLKKALLIGLPVLLVAALGAIGLLTFSDHGARANAQPTVVSTPDWTLPPTLSYTDRLRADQQRITTAIDSALSAQSAALLAGDQAGFVGFADPAAQRVAPWLTGRFASLHAMGVAQWDASVTSVTSALDPEWQAFVQVRYCFVRGCPRPSTVDLDTEWNMTDEVHPRIAEMFDHTEGQASPPWANTVLKAKAGARAVVVASAANAGRLPRALAAAEAAARTADSYAGAAKPGKYVIYLAGGEEWDLWSEGDEGRWVAGYATVQTESVVLRVSALRTTGLGRLLRHEMTHVASLAGRSSSVKRADAWWLTEGLAEYAADGKSFASYAARAQTVAFVRSGWRGDLRVGAPAKKASVNAANGRYGTAYLGVRCLMQKYGRAKAVGFFDAVAVEGTPLTTAASDALGVPWPSVKSTCATQIRAAAR